VARVIKSHAGDEFEVEVKHVAEIDWGIASSGWPIAAK